jgi:hypothetical protein
MIGWVKLHRKVLHSDMYRSLTSKQRDVMLTCILLANHSENDWEFDGKIYKCKPGQFITSLQKIADFCGKDVKVQSVRTALLKLEKWGFLTNESTKQNRLITICKWETYQQIENEANKEDNSQLTNDQQSVNKRLTTNKNDKNVENDNNNKRAFAADANKSLDEYRELLRQVIQSKSISRDQLFMANRIDLERKNEIWTDFLKNSIINVPLIEDEKHVWNTFKKFIQDNGEKYKVGKKSGVNNFKGF